MGCAMPRTELTTAPSDEQMAKLRDKCVEMAEADADVARLERELVACLTDACETAKAEIVGFTWLTHRLDPEVFPTSLRITWVFEHEADKAAALAGEAKARMLALTR